MRDHASPASADLTDDAAPPTRARQASAEERTRQRHHGRWLWWLSVLTVLVALRIALPFVVGPFVEERLSRALGARVEVGDVGFAPIDAVVTLGNVTVQRPGAPEPADGADEPQPAISAARVRLDLQWLPLLHRALVAREVALESARIELERSPDGGTSLDRLLDVDAAPELPPGWSFAVDRVVLRDSKVLVHDAGDDAAPLELRVRDAEFATRRRRASAFKRAPNLHVDVLVEGGRIRVDGTSDLRDDGVVVDALLRVKDVPLERLREYLPDLGGATLAGRLSGQLHYQRDPGRRDLLDGRLRARRVTVQVPTLDEPALSVRRVEAELDALDLRRRRVAVESLTLHGARLALRPDVTAPVPLLDGLAAEPAPARGRKRRATAIDDDQKRWSWGVTRFASPYARVHVVGTEPEIVLPATVAGENLGPAAYWSPVRAWLGRGEQSATFDGTARMTRGFSMDGRLTAQGIDAAAFARAFDLPLAELVQAGVASADLGVDVAPGAAEGPPVAVRGKISVEDLWLAGPDRALFALGAAKVDLKLDGIGPAAGPRGSVRPTALHFGDATIRRPYVLLTRVPDGWLVPPFADDPALLYARLPSDPDAPRPAPTVIPAAAVEQAPPAPDAATPLVLGNVTSVGGRVVIVDLARGRRTGFDVELLEGWARDVRLPALTASQLVLQGSDRRFGRVQLAGTRIGGASEIELSAQDVPLAVVTPYLQQAELPYAFDGGTASFLARVSYAGGGWSADTTLALHQPQLAGDDALLRRTLGMPVEDAIATLRDPDGDVTLRLALGSRDGRDVPAMVANAVRAAVARARLAPIPEAPIEIAFSPGSDELGMRAAQELGEIAYLLATRSDAVVVLNAVVSHADRRWLAEQEAARYLEEPGGFLGVLRAIGVRDQNTRIREALAERRAGRPGRLSWDDEAALRELVAAAPPIEGHRLQAIAAARASRVADELVRRHGVAPSRIVIHGPGTLESAAPPAVQATIDVDAGLEPSTVRAEARPW